MFAQSLNLSINAIYDCSFQFRSNILLKIGSCYFFLECICPVVILFKKNFLYFLTNPKSKSKVQVQVQADDWVFIKIRFSNHPASHPGKFQRSKIPQHIQNKSCQYILGDYETCFGISLDPKTIRCQSKRAKNRSIQDFFNHVELNNI